MVHTLIVMLVLGCAVAPLAAAFLALVLPNTKASNTVVQIFFILGGMAGVVGAGCFLFFQNRGLEGIFLLPWGALDHLSAYFLLLINIGVVLASWFACSYLPRYASMYSLRWVNTACALFVFGMLATVVSQTVVAFLFFWELMSIAAYFLVIADRTSQSIAAGLKYLIMTQLGAACLFAGFLLLANGNPIASLSSLAGSATGSVGMIAFFLLFAGFAGKAGIFPLHGWLPDAHPASPSHASALMSAVMLKVALYGFLRTIETVMHFNVPTWAICIVLALGLFSAFYGALMAAIETDLKRLLAWSSIENMGLLFAMGGTIMFLVNTSHIGLAALASVALLIHAFNHTIFKSGLFMAAGATISETHSRDIDVMGGLAHRWPGFSKWFLGLVFAGAALPPLGTFYGEWIFVQSVASSFASQGVLANLVLVIVLSVFALTAGLALFAFVKLFASVFLGKPRSDAAAHVKPLSIGMYAPVAATVVLSVLMGLLVPQYVQLIWPHAVDALYKGTTLLSAEGSITPWVVIVILAGAVLVGWLLRRYASNKAVRQTDTWDCGQPLTNRMEYTATGFAAPIRFFFRGFTLPWKRVIVTPLSPHNTWIVSRTIAYGVRAVAEEFIYEPVVATVRFLSSHLRRLQNGRVQFYIALVFFTLVISLFVAL